MRSAYATAFAWASASPALARCPYARQLSIDTGNTKFPPLSHAARSEARFHEKTDWNIQLTAWLGDQTRC